MITTAVSGLVDRTASSTSMPERSGMLWSVSTRSKGFSLKRVTASLPPPASATSKLCFLRNPQTSSRWAGSSSTTRMRKASAIGRLAEGKRNPEAGAAAGLAHSLDRAAVGLDDAPDDREPEPEPLGLRRHVWLEHLRKQFRGDAAPGIRHGDGQHSAGGSGDLERPARGHGLDRVQYQVEQHLLETVTVGMQYRQTGRNLPDDGDAGFARFRLHEAQHFLEESRHDDGLALEGHRPGQREEFLDDRVEAPDLALDQVHHAQVLLARSRLELHAEPLDSHRDRVERIAELVGHRGGHVPDRGQALAALHLRLERLDFPQVAVLGIEDHAHPQDAEAEHRRRRDGGSEPVALPYPVHPCRGQPNAEEPGAGPLERERLDDLVDPAAARSLDHSREDTPIIERGPEPVVRLALAHTVGSRVGEHRQVLVQELD